MSSPELRLAQAILAAEAASEPTAWAAELTAVGVNLGTLVSVSVTVNGEPWSCQWSGAFALEVAVATSAGQSLVGQWVKVTAIGGRPLVEYTINGS